MRIDFQKVISFWMKTADLKWETAKSLKRSKKYADCLFFCHLVLESLLKALVCQEKKMMPPYSHELDDLAELSGCSFPRSFEKILAEVNTFNIRARYDDYKMTFYRKATPRYTKVYYQKTDEIRIWLLTRLTNERQNITR